MDKRVILAAGLSILILFGWDRFVVEPRRAAAVASAVDQAIDVPVVSERGSEPAVASDADRRIAAQDVPSDEPYAGSVQADAEQTTAFDNDVYDLVLTNRGARVLSWKLREYTLMDGSPLELIPQSKPESSDYLAVELDDQSVSEQLDVALWALERSPAAAADDRSAGETFTYRWSDGRGIEATKSLTFRTGSYLVEVELSVTDRGRRLPARIALGPGFAAQEGAKKKTSYNYEGDAVWNRKGEIGREDKKTLVKGPGGFPAPTELTWAGLNDQYFAALVVTDGARADVKWRSRSVIPVDSAGATQDAVDRPVLSVSIPDSGALLFVGPKKYDLVKRLGHDLEGAIYFSSMAWLRPIVTTLFRGLLWIADHTFHNYGFAIIIATFMLRLLLFPVNQYAMVSMKKTQMQMQKLQPKIKSIRNKFKKAKDAESRARMNQEMMELYRKEGVNPMGGLNGCLPLVAQFPILIGFYNMLTVAIELRGAPFILWITDLSVEDPWKITPLLMGATMFVQQKMAMSKIKDPQQLQQQRIMLFMPVMFTVICLGLPSGMVLYWFVNNLLGIGQQWLVNRHTERIEAGFQETQETQKA